MNEKIKLFSVCARGGNNNISRESSSNRSKMILKSQWVIPSDCYCHGAGCVLRCDGSVGKSAGSYRFVLNAMMVVVFVGVVVGFVKKRVVLTIGLDGYVLMGLVF